MKYEFIALFTALLFFNGCGMINGMKDKMDETKNYVRQTSETSEDIRVGQQVTAAIEILLHSPEWHARVTAAETLFLRGPEDRISKYIGTPPVPMRWPMAPRVLFGRSVSVPNVTYMAPSAVGTPEDPELMIAGVSAEFYRIISFTAQNLLEQFFGKSQLPDLYKTENAAELRQTRTDVKRLIYVTTAILGGGDLAALREGLLETRPRTFKKNAGERCYYANLLTMTACNVKLDPENPENEVRLLRELQSLIEIRLSTSCTALRPGDKPCG